MSEISEKIRDKIFAADSSIHQISNEVAAYSDDSTLDAHYLHAKMQVLVNTAKHVLGQLDFIKKEQARNRNKRKH